MLTRTHGTWAVDRPDGTRDLSEVPSFPEGQGLPGRPARDGGAVTSFVLGLIGVVVPVAVVAPIPAFVLGYRARRRIRTSQASGARAATAGMVLGVIGMGWVAWAGAGV